MCPCAAPPRGAKPAAPPCTREYVPPIEARGGARRWPARPRAAARSPRYPVCLPVLPTPSRTRPYLARGPPRRAWDLTALGAPHEFVPPRPSCCLVLGERPAHPARAAAASKRAHLHARAGRAPPPGMNRQRPGGVFTAPGPPPEARAGSRRRAASAHARARARVRAPHSAAHSPIVTHPHMAPRGAGPGAPRARRRRPNDSICERVVSPAPARTRRRANGPSQAGFPEKARHEAGARPFRPRRRRPQPRPAPPQLPLSCWRPLCVVWSPKPPPRPLVFFSRLETNKTLHCKTLSRGR